MDDKADRFTALQLQLVLESPSINIFSLDRSYRYTSFNRMHASTMRALWNVEVAVGMSLLDEVIQDAQDRAKAKSTLDSVLSGAEMEVLEAYGGPTKRRLFESRYSPLRMASGEVVGVTIFAPDVTERVQLAEERAALNQKLLEASHLESLGLMVGCVAHDFNNLLVPILLSAEMARSSVEEGNPAAEYLATVIDSTKMAAELTKQLLNFSDHGTGKKELVDLNALIRGAADLARVSVRRRAELQVLLAEQNIFTWAIAPQLRQLISNLLINASEATQGPHPKVKLETFTLRVTGTVESQVVFPPRVAIGDYAVISVHDNGCGMTNEQLEQIFEPFYSTKGSGRGLGLTAAQGIVRNHQGFLAVDSELGRGTTFRIGIPLAEDSIAESMENITTPFGVAESCGVPMRILIADDNERSLQCLRTVCERFGHTVVTAANGIATIVAATTQVFDLILLDADLIDVSCEEILRSIPLGITAPVALMSGEAHEATLISNPRVHSILAKPFTVESLCALLLRFQPRGSGYAPANSHTGSNG